MKHLVIGAGEIGTALQKVFKCDIRDLEEIPVRKYDVLHIAIRNSKKFVSVVNAYKKLYKAKYVVVHSTVPVGTCRKAGFIHSPVTGIHPHLAKSLKKFTKFVSNKKIAEEFRKYGIPAVYVKGSDNTEAGKLYALLIYGINIALEKEIFRYCKKNKLNYDVVYRQFVKMYNEGYKKMGMNHIKMYELTHQEGVIGKHCVMQNSPLLKTPLTKVLVRENKRNVI
jgi:hypothetical protein